jgi:hypothetical protein
VGRKNNITPLRVCLLSGILSLSRSKPTLTALSGFQMVLDIESRLISGGAIYLESISPSPSAQSGGRFSKPLASTEAFCLHTAAISLIATSSKFQVTGASILLSCTTWQTPTNQSTPDSNSTPNIVMSIHSHFLTNR